LCEVIEPRAEETLHLIQEKIRASGYLELLGSGIVLTGGASQLDGLIEMGEFIFDVPVRSGTPTRCGGLTDVVRSPVYATGIGLLHFAIGQMKHDPAEKKMEEASRGFLGTWARRVKEYFSVAQN
jgi:cell division protein FtsA